MSAEQEEACCGRTSRHCATGTRIVDARCCPNCQHDDDRPCSSESYSLDYFAGQQGHDAYWMRCQRLGPHDEHENSETGATWHDRPASEVTA